MGKGTMKKTGKGGLGCLMLFCLPFAAVGVVMAWQLVSTVWTWQAMQSWEEVPAQIEHADLEEHDGDSGTTYRCVARYSYEYGGQRHTGTRVALGSGSDNIGSFQQGAYSELAGYRDSGEPFRCYVDPRDPGNAILYRDLRWEMLLLFSAFVVTFGGAGFGLMGAAIWGLRMAREEEQLHLQYVDKPWLWKKEWATGEIRSSTKVKMVSVLVFATFWNAIAIPIGALVVSEVVLREGERKGLFVLIFPAIGLLLIVWGVKAVIGWRKFGSSVFRMAEVPGVIGGKLSGVVDIPTNIRPEDGFHLTLSCINKVTSGSGKNRSTREDIRWQDARVMSHELLEDDPTRSSVPVAFGIPYDASPTDDSDSDNETMWRLEVKAAVPGVDYEGQFEVPVFKTEASSPGFVLDETPLADYAAESDPMGGLRVSGITVTPLPSGGVRLDFPAARHKSIAAGTTVFFLIWSGIVVFVVMVGAPILFPIVFGLFEVLLGWFVLDLWFGSSRVQARFQTLEFSCGLFGGRTRTLYFEKIREIKPAQGMQSGTKLFYSLKVTTTDGKSYTLAKRLDGLKVAETVVEQLTRTGTSRGKWTKGHPNGPPS